MLHLPELKLGSKLIRSPVIRLTRARQPERSNARALAKALPLRLSRKRRLPPAWQEVLDHAGPSVPGAVCVRARIDLAMWTGSSQAPQPPHRVFSLPTN